MLSYLGFDTVIVDNGLYDSASLSVVFEKFAQYGVKKFVFLSDFSLANNSFSLENIKLRNFADSLDSICPRGVRGKVFYNLLLDSGSAFNPEFKRLYAVKKHSSVFCSLPYMLESSYEDISKDMNNMLYRHKAFPIFSNFDKVLATSSPDACYKLLNDIKAGFCFDIGYLLDPSNIDTVKMILKNNSNVILKISKNISEYECLLQHMDIFMENIGKQNYYKLCHDISKCCDKISH